jgi:hypothetical protein
MVYRNNSSKGHVTVCQEQYANGAFQTKVGTCEAVRDHPTSNRHKIRLGWHGTHLFLQKGNTIISNLIIKINDARVWLHSHNLHAY